MKIKNNNNSNNIIYFFKKLWRNIFQDLSYDANITNKFFLNSFDFFPNIKLKNIINIFANNTFKYHIRSRDIIIFLINPMSYSFIISTNILYNNSIFKKLLIDLDIIIKFIDNCR